MKRVLTPEFVQADMEKRLRDPDILPEERHAYELIKRFWKEYAEWTATIDSDNPEACDRAIGGFCAALAYFFNDLMLVTGLFSPSLPAVHFNAWAFKKALINAIDKHLALTLEEVATNAKKRSKRSN